VKTLVLGGIRSGKSAVAETHLAAAPSVTYIACGPRADDADWAARIAAHQARRPAAWVTVETTELSGILPHLAGPALVDCLGTWLTARLDALGAWEAPREAWADALAAEVDALAAAVTAARHDVVLVSNEVGFTLVSEHRSGRIFADWLGITNQAVAAVCDRVDLVVAGQVLTVKAP